MNDLHHLMETSMDFVNAPIRVAYFLTSRELAFEEPFYNPENREGAELNGRHRGNLPFFAQAIRNGRITNTMLSLIVMNDDTAYRDFSDLSVPIHIEPSSAFIQTTRKGTPERNAAKTAYEQRLRDVLEGHRIDFIVCDRYMIIHGSAMLDAFFGLMVNTHPARLPNLPGATPTTDALERAHTRGFWFTGNTLHIIDSGIDTGPPIRQAEITPIHAQDEHWDLRRRNYEYEGRNLVAGVTDYLMEQPVQQLVAINRLLRTSRDGIHTGLSEIREDIRSALLARYRNIFHNRQRHEERWPAAPGTYVYSAYKEQQLGNLPWPARFHRREFNGLSGRPRVVR